MPLWASAGRGKWKDVLADSMSLEWKNLKVAGSMPVATLSSGLMNDVLMLFVSIHSPHSFRLPSHLLVTRLISQSAFSHVWSSHLFLYRLQCHFRSSSPPPLSSWQLFKHHAKGSDSHPIKDLPLVGGWPNIWFENKDADLWGMGCGGNDSGRVLWTMIEDWKGFGMTPGNAGSATLPRKDHGPPSKTAARRVQCIPVVRWFYI